MSESPVLLTVEQVAKKLQVGRTLAYRLVLDGEIESIRVGGKLRRVPITALAKYIERALAEEDPA